MGFWSAENATKAYLKTLKMGQKCKEPNTEEFISAIAAGNNAQLMVIACAGAAESSTLALLAAAHQTNGQVICILQSIHNLTLTKNILGHDATRHIKFVIGDAQTLLLNRYKEADFVLIDCNLDNHEDILASVQKSGDWKKNGAVVVGYNAFSKGSGSGSSWRCSGSRSQLLPIGEGLLVTRIKSGVKVEDNNGKSCGLERKSHWIVKVDKFTGEEHVFRVRLPHGKGIKA